MDAGIEHAHLRSALEFAVLMAAEGQKRKPAIPYPKELKPYFGTARLPAGSLGRIRRTIEADPVFRTRLAAGALPELVDEIGRLWLAQPEGWEDTAAELAAAAEAAAESGDLRAQLKQAERRRAAAEQAAARTRAELLQLNEVIESQAVELHELRADVVKADEAVREMRTELVDVRVESRHARDREAAAQARAEAAQADLLAAQAELARRSGEDIDAAVVPAAGRDQQPPARDDTAAIASAAEAARSLADQLDALLPAPERPDLTSAERSAARRRPLALPGGVISTSREAAEFLVRAEAAVLVDGYNVAKLQWRSRTLEEQRRSLLDAVENLARRHGADLTVVFDGASVVGAHAARRRDVRVVFSPAGVLADDVIRDEVRRLPPSRHVVVVTNDAEIVRDVRADGANTLPSNALIALF
ncbi:MAG: hypothetical protein HKN44_05170 [Ilumatobacter sp.]|nr:hypothetical protein [Ilumatobacter sp.]